MEAGVSVNVAFVPSGKDPDEFLLERGIQAFREEVLGKAMDPAEFRTRLEIKRAGGQLPKSSEEKARMAAAVLETIGKQQDAILKNEWMKRLSQKLGLDEGALRTEARRKAQAGGRARKVAAAAPVEKTVALPKAEEEFLQLIMRHPELLSACGDVTPEDFASEAGKSAWTAIGEHAGEPDWPRKLAAEWAAQGQGWLTRMVVDSREFSDPARALLIQKDALRRETTELARFKELSQVAPAMLDGKIAVDMAVIQEYMDLSNRLKGSKKPV
jgi:DNA primase